jgi:hypothetical protein
MTQRAAEDRWKQAGKFAAGIAKGIGNMLKAYFDERPIKF